MVLGDVEETIYVVDEDDEEDDEVKVCAVTEFDITTRLTGDADHQKTVRDAFCQRYLIGYFLSLEISGIES